MDGSHHEWFEERGPWSVLMAYIVPMSQFERAMKELGVDVIHAHSPQATGRIERLFATLQDRLVK